MSSQSGAQSPSITEMEPLKPFTTFKIGGPARYFVRTSSVDGFHQALQLATEHTLPIFVLGGGSNILVSDVGFDGVVIHPICTGIEILHEDEAAVTLQVAPGETWDNLVRYAVERDWWGIENLSHIPGQAGAALVQNIGAYGQQVSDVAQSASVMEVSNGITQELSAIECEFGYRRSIFNTKARGKLIIMGITLKLAKQGTPKLGYQDVRKHFQERGGLQPSLGESRQAIISIRDRKFPFPREERGGNAGSFFKNLSLTEGEYDRLQENVRQNFPQSTLDRLQEIRHRFPAKDRIRIPTAFLIEICDLKGFQIGGVKVNESQPLVLLNQGGATASDVIALARHIKKTVRTRTAVELAIEPELIGFTPQEIADVNNPERS